MRLLRKHGLWLVLAGLVGVVGAWLVSASLPVRYTSTAQVDIESHAVIDIPESPPNLATEKLVATSGVVLDGAARVLGIRPEVLSKDLTALESGTSNILLISCTTGQAALAERCANADASAYIAFRNLASSSKSARAADPLHATLVTPALLPDAPSGIGKKILLPVGALLGLLLGFGGIFLRDWADDRVRDRLDLEQCLGTSVVAVVPEVPRYRRLLLGASPVLIYERAPESRAAESYRYLRARLDSMIEARPGVGCVLLVTGAHPREGRTCVAANLAFAMARAGRKVMLVDADSRHPVLSQLFGGYGRAGLTDLLAERVTADQAAATTSFPGLRLVSIGDVTDQPAEFFSESRLSRAFGELRAEAEVIVVDSAPLLAVSDAIALSRVSDLVLMVASVRCTRRAEVSAAMREIGKTEPARVAAVLNAVSGSFSIGPVRPDLARRTRWSAASTTLAVSQEGLKQQAYEPSSLASLAAQNGRPDAQAEHGEPLPPPRIQ
jgi:polysaccharide biosynthesis transport protein